MHDSDAVTQLGRAGGIGTYVGHVARVPKQIRLGFS
jgi:hypothetical protein